ncbi:MAG: PAS domain S-box protein [Polaromonas sp.]|uniref:PAS domain S-box protein n=1 Tax=Polaromonas sp. TaxID=1869339 RepID=UPI0024896933|nr:PAS domain S-box protein [Polaromonas sp.]MDI1271453.1 PAS domain S-box protein [Polaromonas sp.]
MPSSSINTLDLGDSTRNGAAALLAGVLESAMDAIITVDEQQRIVMYNHAAEQVFGWSRQEVLLQPLEKLMPQRFRADHAQNVERYGNTGVTSRRMGGRRVIYGLRRNGEEFPLDASISVLHTAEGKLFTTIVRDITELDRLQREQADNDARLRESQRRLQAAQRLARIGYWQIDLDTNLMWWCDQACDVLGVERSLLDASYEGLLRLIHPGDRQAFATERDAAVRAGLPLDAEFRVITDSGEERWIHLLGWIEGEGEGEGTQARRRTGLIREITNRKRSEGVIARSLELLNHTGALAKVGGWEVVMESMATYCSDEIFRIHELDPSAGVTLEGLLGFYAPEVHPVIRAAVDAAIRHATPWDLDLPLVTAKGRRTWVRTQGQAILQDGKLVRLFGVLQDITEIKATEAALRMSNHELEAFSYSVSHDLRSPLNSINGFSHLLARKVKGTLDADAKHYLARIQAGTRQMGQLIEGLLALAEVSRTLLGNELVDLSTMARAILDDWQVREPGRHVVVHIEKGLQTRGDARLIRVGMDNLLENAWKFSSQKALAEITVGQKPAADGRLAFFVSDNGTGFDMAYANKLFTPFQRLHGVTEFSGMGIGLATVSRVITRHGGRLWAEAAPGRGATFFFTLPGGVAAAGGGASQLQPGPSPSPQA